MKEISLTLKTIEKSEAKKSGLFSNKRSRLTFAVCFCAVSGILCGLIGFLLTFISVLETAEFRSLNSKIGSLFIFAAFPLFFLAAHSLDRIDDIKKEEKLKHSVNK